jgi:hypothetical protein
MELLPQYFLVYETPVGVRYCYPVPELEGYPTSWGPEVTWVVPGCELGRVVVLGRWLVSDEQLGEVIASWLPPKVRGPHRKVECLPVGSYARGMWEFFPTRPSEEMITHVEDCGDGECLRCAVFREIYEREWVQPPAEARMVSFTEWQPLPGGVVCDRCIEMIIGGADGAPAR